VHVVVHVDGGARGNPGPAAAAAVLSDPGGRVLDRTAVTLGRATNNVAEYRALLLGLERAAALGATEVDVINDSELVAKQVNGEYKVKNADLKPLHAAAHAALEGFERWSIRSVPRAENAEADALVNSALDGEDSAPPDEPAAPGVSPAPSAALPDVLDRADELWLGQIAAELTAARDALAGGRPGDAAPALWRAAGAWRVLLAQQDLRDDPAPEPRALRTIESLSRELNATPALPDAAAELLREHDELAARWRGSLDVT
jgi:ribonuclease HI